MEGRGKGWVEELMKGETEKGRKEGEEKTEGKRGEMGSKGRKKKNLYNTLMKNIYFI